MKNSMDDDLRPEYRREDLGRPVRGKHHKAFREGVNLVLLRPDVAAAFPTDQAVNSALRSIMESSGSSKTAITPARKRSRARAGATSRESERMVAYYVNVNPQSNGDHEVHAAGCSYLPDLKNCQPLGEFSSCESALQKAKDYFNQVNGCYYCAQSCYSS